MDTIVIPIRLTAAQLDEAVAFNDHNAVLSLAFAEECAVILVRDYGAKDEWINRSIFFWSHMGQLIEQAISGKPTVSALDAVAWKVEVSIPRLG